MPRPQSLTPERIVDGAVPRFWNHGYGATSIDDLVRETGTSRHALYQAFGGKRELFLACLDAYSEIEVTPAFARLEREGAKLRDIADFFEHQIAHLEAEGLPGSGCLFANTMTEVAPHDADISARVRVHNDRLAAGFRKALRNSIAEGQAASPHLLAELSTFLAISAQGLWSASRSIADASILRRYAATLLQFVQHRLAG
jgi:TetR/AcrR family transcriptional regulator, transcriptional repressor for nem operon